MQFPDLCSARTLFATRTGPTFHVIVGSGNGWRLSRPAVDALVGSRESWTMLMLRSLAENPLWSIDTLLVLLTLIPYPPLPTTVLLVTTALAEISSEMPCFALWLISLF